MLNEFSRGTSQSVAKKKLWEVLSCDDDGREGGGIHLQHFFLSPQKTTTKTNEHLHAVA